MAFAESILPTDTKWAHATLCLGQQSEHDISDPRQYLALQGRILARIREWLLSLGLPAHHLWVREIGPRYGHHHSHVLLPLPPELRPDLANLIRRVGKLHDTSNNRAVVITPERHRWDIEPDTRGLHTRAQRAGIVRDMCKTLSPRAHLDGVRIIDALGIRHRAQCTIAGKRSGLSQTLCRTARARAGWQELETLPDLRAALPTGKEARKERNRANTRRYRARKKAGIAPMPCSSTRLSRPEAVLEPDPFDLEAELAADFLEAEEVIEPEHLEHLPSR
ncbi:MAG TPA: hypothetical protein VEX11_02805 [Acetobacteraceae bacterium]|nr:hypothetical protein [Acetobacteraceae bacterium]